MELEGVEVKKYTRTVVTKIKAKQITDLHKTIKKMHKLGLNAWLVKEHPNTGTSVGYVDLYLNRGDVAFTVGDWWIEHERGGDIEIISDARFLARNYKEDPE